MRPFKLIVLAIFFMGGTYTFAQDDFYPSKSNEKSFDSGSEEIIISDEDYSTANDYYEKNRSLNDKAQEERYTTTTDSYEDENGNTYITNNYYDDVDYYDYEYSSRIRRFRRSYGGYGYYDDCYTNYYWYDYNPYNFGVSVYTSYGWWNPRPWRTGIAWSYFGGPNYWNIAYGGYYGHAYYGNFYPFHAYGSYWRGYNHGFNDGYYAGNYYNSFDNNSHYYKHRKSASGASVYGSNRSSSSGNYKTFGQKYEAAIADGRYENSRITNSPSKRAIPTNKVTRTTAPNRAVNSTKSATVPNTNRPMVGSSNTVGRTATGGSVNSSKRISSSKRYNRTITKTPSNNGSRAVYGKPGPVKKSTSTSTRPKTNSRIQRTPSKNYNKTKSTYSKPRTNSTPSRNTYSRPASKSVSSPSRSNRGGSSFRR